jgi:pimeloyl-ACP methyl ester carboxylesterase
MDLKNFLDASDVSTETGNAAGIGAAPAALDALVDQTRARFGVERVNLVAHSLGTFISGIYLSDPIRAAKVSRYIGVDGASNPTCGSTAPTTLSCMGIFRGSAGNVGGKNVYFKTWQQAGGTALQGAT